MERIITAISLLFAAATLFAAEPVNMSAGPWVTNVTDSGFNVVWMTKDACMSYLEIAPCDGHAFNSQARPRYYQTISGRAVITRFHNIRVDGLKPGTKYMYRMFLQQIAESSNPYNIIFGKTLATTRRYWEDFTVTTADYKAAECRFSMLNDMHCTPEKYSGLLAGKTEKDMDFLLLNGDISSDSGNIDSVARYTFTPAQALLTTVPVLYARGNHESRGMDFDKVPLLIPTSTGEFYYIYRQGPAAFLVLDAAEDKPDSSTEYSGYAHFDDYRAKELEWLKKAIKDPLFSSAPMKIAVMHVPPRREASSWYTDLWLVDNFVPVLNEAGIDVMLSGHKHKYGMYGKGACGNNFPILVNSHVDRLDVKVTASQISIKIFDRSGKEIHSHDIKK